MKKTFIKRFAVVLLTLIIAFGAFACKKNKTQSGTDDPGTAQEINTTVTVPLPDYSKYPLTGNYLVRDGKSDYTIVVPAEAQTVETNAANELAQYLSQTTGVKPKIVSDDTLIGANASGKYISVGDTTLYKAQSWTVDDLAFNDSFKVKTVGNTLFLIGRTGRSTLYAVYDFIEYGLGVKFLSPVYEHIPEVDEVPLRQLDIEENPTFDIRTNFYYPTDNNEDWTAKMRYYSKRLKNEDKAAKIGGVLPSFLAGGFHQLSDFVPFDTYYSQHPEWFSSSVSTKYQVCYSNGLNDDGTVAPGETVIGTVIENLTKTLIDRPEVIYAVLGQNDNWVICNCDRCLEQVEYLGGMRSAQQVLFVNTVAREVKERLEAVGRDTSSLMFGITSYQWSVAAPIVQNADGEQVVSHPLAIPRDDIFLYFAPSEACYLHAFNDPECTVNNFQSNAYFTGWKKITKNFFVWDYIIDFSDHPCWYPNIGILQQNLRYFRDSGVVASLPEGALTGRNIYEIDLVNYIETKLMWNCDYPVNEIKAEFDRYYFGEQAGSVMTQFTNYMNAHFEAESRATSSLRHAHMYTAAAPWIVSADTITKPFIDGAYTYINKAYELIKNDSALTSAQKEAYNRNILSAEIQLMWLMYKNYDQNFYTSDQDKYDFMNRLVDTMRFLDIGNAVHGTSLEDTISTILGTLQ